MTMPQPVVSAIVLNYLTWEQTVDAVADLLAQAAVELDVVIVDNASPNDSLAQLEARFGRHARVHILATEHNGGYARGNNRGARWRLARGSRRGDRTGRWDGAQSTGRAHPGEVPHSDEASRRSDTPQQCDTPQRSDALQHSEALQRSEAAERALPDYLLIVNNDVRLPDRGAVATLAAFAAAHADAGMVGPRVLTSAGFPQGPYRRPRPLICCLRYGLPIIPLVHRLWRRWCWREEKSRPCFALVGACLLLPAAAFAAAGMFDEATFLGAEEYILAERLRAQGRRSYYVPTTWVRHEHRLSAIRRTGGETRYLPLGVASMAYYFRRYQRAPESWIALFETVAAWYGRVFLPLRQRLPL
jgi:GT2 family glycosyltransferase